MDKFLGWMTSLVGDLDGYVSWVDDLDGFLGWVS